jgi:hypothetical protein
VRIGSQRIRTGKRRKLVNKRGHLSRFFDGVSVLMRGGQS